MGTSAGSNITTGSNNIHIANTGLTANTHTIRVGAIGTHTAAYVAGISEAVVPGGTTVVIDGAGHLGTMVSSHRFKDEIRPMGKASEAILALQPITFRYKKEFDPTGAAQFGLVAEEVEKVNPDLVVHDGEGKPYSVRYDQVNAMLLNEFLKEHKKVEAQGCKLQHQAREIQQQYATIAQLKDEMASVAASVKEQAAQIQKVSAQLETSKPASKVVVNNQ